VRISQETNPIHWRHPYIKIYPTNKYWTLERIREGGKERKREREREGIERIKRGLP